MLRSKPFLPAAALFAYLALSNAGCQSIPFLAVAAPGVFFSLESGIRHEVLEFESFEGEVEIRAPASRVWECMTTISSFPGFYAWMESVKLPKADGATMQPGLSFDYAARIAGRKENGTAVVTEMVPERSLVLTLFARSNGSLIYRVEAGQETTRLSLLLTTQPLDLSMVRPISKVRKFLKASVDGTLQSIKQESEGGAASVSRPPAGETAAPGPGYSIPFDTATGTTVIDVTPQEAWMIFDLRGKDPRLFRDLDKAIPRNEKNVLAVPGNGIYYTEKLGSLKLKGTAVVTSVIQGCTVGLTLLEEFEAGAQFLFLPAAGGGTEFSALYYLRIPDRHDGKPVDRPAVLESMKETTQKDLDEFKEHCEKLKAHRQKKEKEKQGAPESHDN